MNQDYTEQAIDILNHNYDTDNLELIVWKRDETLDGKNIVLQYTFMMGRKIAEDIEEAVKTKSVDMDFINLGKKTV